ncbi:haloacid dehalogenase [Fructilactobacillus lindneri]|uniref:Haloacid dehalogenase n=2 Tax=Fructilactobacillus lindneri TaxID=53444 RepID=A0AB33BI95_9LACO|nr:cation-transporting P-type ATPase [Fructilactobacillus lindneri]ANZ57774.1 haloacid dehalogenase [Fructilactobacillus lindneri]ANZ59043.1 haloacid dehalogenase [Fructilactobacillus lindneri]POG98096.1 haloacid dehalogenase [Fructilactobacillus lindneri]POH01789.1 haloacid dehalogenase [Fructilactobacillus lindneri]POH03633.1 haloacid dehalogenase [Fructilactobacillus lindneri]
MDHKMTDDDYAQLPVAELVKDLGSSVTDGLTNTEVQQKLKTVGKNVIEKGQKENGFWNFIKNFTSLMACLLWVSGVIAILAGTPELGIAIWAVNIINGLFSYWEEHAAKKATDALSKMLPTYVSVIRDGKKIQVIAEDLVPGDLVVLQAGDAIPADARVLSSSSLQVDESALTGESVPVDKFADYKHGDGKFAIDNIVFAGTVVTSGTATVMVVETGMNTEFGQIAKLTQNQKGTVSPLTKELNRLTRQLSVLALVIGLGFFVLAIFFVHYPIAKSFIFALGMIVAFIPEGLLPTVTLSLAHGTKVMAKKHALLKNLDSVETLGETNVICSDKTGTLTQNQMTVNHIWLPDKEYTVTGTGYFNNGKIQFNQQDVNLKNEKDLSLLLDIALLNNDTKVQGGEEGKTAPKILGTPTEAGLNILTAKGGLDLDQRMQATPRLKELPFDSTRRRMTTLQQESDGKVAVYVKGALSNMMQVCDRILINGEVRPMTNADKTKIDQANQDYAAQGLRSLAFAYNTIAADDVSSAMIENTEQHLIFVGLAVMQDPPREEIYDAVKKCHSADIKIIMVTGDSSLTAKSIAVKIGIVSDKARVITGAELNQMSDDELRQAVKGEVIFARVAPEDKYRIVSMCQANGEIVAATGDGVNDAPALKKANIGIAMGVTGTDVAKEAADMILTDDNFASIVSAIEEGRTVYSNIQKFLVYIFNSNLSEAFPSLLFIISGGLIPLALTVMQILTVDLGTDMLPALGLGAEKSEPGIMDRPPRKRDAHLLNKGILLKSFCYYGLIGSLVSAAAYFFVNWQYGWPSVSLAHGGYVYAAATTMTLAAIVFCQVATVLNCRTETTSLFKIGIFSNHRIMWGIVFEICLLTFLIYVPFVHGLFGTAPINLLDWIYLLCIPVPLILIDEARKWFIRKYMNKKKAA